MACPARAHYRMFHTVAAVERAAGGRYRARAAELECAAARDEKNWVAFVDGEALRYVYQLSPHLVVTQDAQGRCAHGEKYLDLARAPWRASSSGSRPCAGCGCTGAAARCRGARRAHSRSSTPRTHRAGRVRVRVRVRVRAS